MKYLLLLSLLCGTAQANPIAIAIAIAEAEAAPVKVVPKVVPKVTPPVKVAPKQYNTRYKKGPAYVEPNTRASYINHLASDIHGFDRAWLNTQNSVQLFALHSDAHHNCVDYSKAVRRKSQALAPVPVKSSGCPNGQCARPTRRLFRQ